MQNLLCLIVAGCLTLMPTVATSQAAEPAATDEAEEAEEAKASAAKVADAHGIDAWPEVAEIHYTFKVAMPNREVARQWQWNVAKGEVTRVGYGNGITFRPDEVTAESSKGLKEAHQQFINDSYWFLFPFQLEWSTYTPVLHDEPTTAPISDKEVTRLDIVYPGEGGYTPGDTYRLFLDDDHRIVEWTFARPGGQPKHHTWESLQQLGPIQVYTDHRAGENFRLHFTDVKLIDTDGNTHELQPLDAE